jgi:fatty acid desaturase
VSAVPDQTSDLSVFFAELDALGAEVRADCSQDDLDHLRRIERVGRACTALGWATSWMGPNLFSVLMLAQGRTTRWTTVAHHVSHGGYKRVPGVPARYTPDGFAKGARRFTQWLDVIHPEAWHVEHNRLHHARLGEPADPDFVQRNLDWLRDSDMPPAAKTALVALMASTWKWIYYAPNTFQELVKLQTGQRRSLKDPRAWLPVSPDGRQLWASMAPYAAINFALLPLAIGAVVGPGAAASAATNSLLAEWVTNLHTFLIITTNHAGDDVGAWENAPSDRQDFLYRQIVGSVNYRTGGDVNDLLHGWLNYQIEHHLWPDLSMLQYRKVQPKVKALCERHGVPYVQQSVFKRLRKTLRVMTGRETQAFA